MNIKKPIIIFILCGALITGPTAFSLDKNESSLPVTSPVTSLDHIEGDTYRLERAYLITIHIPNADVDRVLESLVKIVSVEYGKKYDQVIYINAPGFEQFHPKSQSKSGDQSTVMRDPSTVVSFSIPHDTAVLHQAINALHKAHSYEEPVIYITEVWRTQATKPDENNPNRWWNRKPK